MYFKAFKQVGIYIRLSRNLSFKKGDLKGGKLYTKKREENNAQK